MGNTYSCKVWWFVSTSIQCIWIEPTSEYRDEVLKGPFASSRKSPIYRGIGFEGTLDEAPIGAIWNADWMPIRQGEEYFVVRLPGGSDWAIDGPSFNADLTEAKSRGWTRTGTPPNLTVTPSIQIHSTGYHAFLTNGVLVACSDSRI